MGEKLNLLIRYYRSSTVVVSTARHHCYDPWVRVGLRANKAGSSFGTPLVKQRLTQTLTNIPFDTFASSPLTMRVLSAAERPQEQDESVFTYTICQKRGFGQI